MMSPLSETADTVDVLEHVVVAAKSDDQCETASRTGVAGRRNWDCVAASSTSSQQWFAVRLLMSIRVEMLRLNRFEPNELQLIIV